MVKLAAFLLAIGVYLILTAPASAHHTGSPCGAASSDPTGRAVCLPLMDKSAAVATLRDTGRLTYCFNARANNYPNFRPQARQVANDFEAKFGISVVEISGTYETPTEARNAGCQIQNNMPAVHGCNWCGAWVHFLNWPVLVEFRWQAGYSDWRTTIWHEWLHILGLHEHYYDADPVACYRPSRGHWAHGIEPHQNPGTSTNAPTVMDCAVGFYVLPTGLTAYDVRYGCESIDKQGQIFTGCGAQEPGCGDPCWNGSLQPFGRWQFENATNQSATEYEPERRLWWNASGQPEWDECNGDGLRWNQVIEAFVVGSFYKDGYWHDPPPC